MKLEEIHSKLKGFKNTTDEMRSESDKIKGRRAAFVEQLDEMEVGSVSVAKKDNVKLKQTISKRHTALEKDVTRLMDELEG